MRGNARLHCVGLHLARQLANTATRTVQMNVASMVDRFAGQYMVGAFFFSPIFRIGPVPTPATPGFTRPRRSMRALVLAPKSLCSQQPGSRVMNSSASRMKPQGVDLIRGREGRGLPVRKTSRPNEIKVSPNSRR
jgi:hypothetical protein